MTKNDKWTNEKSKKTKKQIENEKNIKQNDIDIIIIPKGLSHLSPEFVAKKFVQKKANKIGKTISCKSLLPDTAIIKQ